MNFSNFYHIVMAQYNANETASEHTLNLEQFCQVARVSPKITHLFAMGSIDPPQGNEDEGGGAKAREGHPEKAAPGPKAGGGGSGGGSHGEAGGGGPAAAGRGKGPQQPQQAGRGRGSAVEGGAPQAGGVGGGRGRSRGSEMGGEGGRGKSADPAVAGRGRELAGVERVGEARMQMWLLKQSHLQAATPERVGV